MSEDLFGKVMALLLLKTVDDNFTQKKRKEKKRMEQIEENYPFFYFSNMKADELIHVIIQFVISYSIIL